jgi:hypothetical protein
VCAFFFYFFFSSFFLFLLLRATAAYARYCVAIRHHQNATVTTVKLYSGGVAGSVNTMAPVENRSKI